MCQLFGMSCSKPADIRISLREFALRGADNPHGWGFAWRDGDDWDLEKRAELMTAKHATLPRLQFTSEIVIGHVRLMSNGKPCCENTHPFLKEDWAFAHNGHLLMDSLRARFKLKGDAPQGDTDSEWIFHYFLEQIQKDSPDVRAALKEACRDLSRLGGMNVLLSDGRTLYAYGHTNLYYAVRRPPFAKATLKRAGVEVDLGKEKDPREKTVLLVTEQLTENEEWQKVEGLMAFRNGAIL